MPERGAWLLERRWAPQIVLALADGSKRFNRLLGDIPGLSDRMLSVRLRELEYLGLATRVVDVGPPVRVEYALTDIGFRYVAPLQKLASVGEEASQAS